MASCFIDTASCVGVSDTDEFYAGIWNALFNASNAVHLNISCVANMTTLRPFSGYILPPLANHGFGFYLRHPRAGRSRVEVPVLYCIVWGRVPAANAPGCTTAEGLLYKPWYLVVPTCTARCLPPETLVVKGGTTWARNAWWILPENARLPRNIQWSFTCRKSTTWDKRLYLPSEGRRAEGFFALKNPTASAGFEPANLGTKCQHATSRPPKPFGVPVRARGFFFFLHNFPTGSGAHSASYSICTVFFLGVNGAGAWS